MKLGAHQAHQLTLEHRREDRVTVRHHGLSHAVESYNVNEEGLSDGLSRVRVRQGNEVAVLAESVHHRQYDRLAPDARQGLHEVKPNVRSDPLGNQQWKE